MNNTILCISDHEKMLGGGEYSFLDLLKHLKKYWKPIVLVPGEGELANYLKKVTVKTSFLEFSKIRPWTFHKVLISIKNLLRMCQKVRPDLIYANGSRSAIYSSILKYIHKKPVIWHCRIADKALISDMLLIRLCDCIITNSVATKKRFEARFEHKIKVIYNGVDLEWLNEPGIKAPRLLNNDWINILVVSRLSRLKGHDIILSAFELVAKKFSNAHLIFLGAKDQFDPEWYEYIEQKINGSNYAKRIRWIGQVNDVRPWYRNAHALVLATKNEAFGRVLIEAMALGVPVIASRSGGIPEIISDNVDGLLAEPGNPKDIANCINRLLRDKDLKRQLIKRGKSRAKQFDLKLHLEKMTEIFDQIITKDR